MPRRDLEVGWPGFSARCARGLLRLGMAALVLGLAPRPTRGEGVDCGAGRSAVEKAVCADPALSKLEQELSRRQDAASRQLSGDGQRLLQEGQGRWRRWVEEVCFGLRNRAGGAGCVEPLYRRRLQDLDAAAVRVGPFLFTRVDYFYALPDAERETPAHGQTSYPHIDAATSEAAKAWNALAAPTTRAGSEGYCDGPGEGDLGFRVVSAAEAAISVEASEEAYCHGAPHGHGAAVGRTYLLAPSVRPLEARDLFAASTSWQAFLTKRCFDALNRKASGALTEADRSRVKRVVTEPRAWTLAREGLAVSMSAGSVQGYAQGSAVVTIAWADLRPYLEPGAPVPK